MKSLLLIIVMLSLFPGITGATNSAADLTGTWVITVERSAEYSGNFTSTIVFKQRGDKLNGDYTGKFGPKKLSGSVKEEKVEFSWQVNHDPNIDSAKGPRPVTFEGLLESPTKMTGTVVAFCGREKCKWTAIKKK
jgi:hypothetical protein